MRARLKALLETYGQVAIVTYFVLFGLVFAGITVAIASGVDISGAAGSAGMLGAAYVATKLTQPLRIAATIALTPLVAAAIKKFKRPPNV